MNDLEINTLLNELHINNSLLKKRVAIQEAILAYEKFVIKNNLYEIEIDNKIDFTQTLDQYSKYSLFLIDKIIDMTDADGKHLYNRKDLANL